GQGGRHPAAPRGGRFACVGDGRGDARGQRSRRAAGPPGRRAGPSGGAGARAIRRDLRGQRERISPTSISFRRIPSSEGEGPGRGERPKGIAEALSGSRGKREVYQLALKLKER